jgi:gamma-glutamyltranspeptidase/glutathione hydrolase
MKNLCLVFLSVFFVQCQTPPNSNEKSGVILSSEIRKDFESAKAKGSQYAVSTQGIYSTQIAKDIFEQKGNIIDVAVAVSFAISVERPHSTGIGGGGFLLFHDGKTKKVFAVDFRERAPKKAYENMFLNADGTPDPKLSQEGILSVGVPGIVAGLIEIHKRFGKLSIHKVMQPSIDLAEKGFPVYPSLRRAMEFNADQLKIDPAAKAIFLDENQKPWPLGHVLVQKDLGKTLRMISRRGSSVFYHGEIARSIDQFSKQQKGILSSKDLNSYKVKWREPVKGNYKGYEIFSMPPPSSGGIHVIQFLNMLEKDSLKEKGFLSTQSIHLAAASLQSAFADRAKFLGDPDFTKVPTSGLINKKYNDLRRSEIPMDRARASSEVFAGEALKYESTDTTHFSIMDNEGNAVSSTQTINGSFGAGIVVPGTGILLNNEMDDFSAKPGASNLFGAIGSKANSVEPGKTPLSSMSPTILVKDGVAVMSVGAPGGTRIISCVAQTILNHIEFQLPLYESVAAVRYHHQWQPDVLNLDSPGPHPGVIRELERMGYKIQMKSIPCNVMATSLDNGIFSAASDPRDIGTSIAK